MIATRWCPVIKIHFHQSSFLTPIYPQKTAWIYHKTNTSPTELNQQLRLQTGAPPCQGYPVFLAPPRPSFTKVGMNRAFSRQPTRRSPAKARLIPPPTAAPLTPQTTGCGILGASPGAPGGWWNADGLSCLHRPLGLWLYILIVADNDVRWCFHSY
jgi:hypothetical protein